MRGKDDCGRALGRLSRRGSGVRRALDGRLDVGRRRREPRHGGRRVGAGSTSVCSTGGTNQEGRRATALPARSARSAAPRRGAGLRGSPPTRSAPRAPRSRPSGRRSSARRARRAVAATATPIRNSTSRKSRGTVRRRRTGAPIERDPGIRRRRRGSALLAAPARLAGGKTRPAEPADVGLQGLDPVGQVADDRRQLVVLLGLAAVRGVLRRAHDAVPPSPAESLAIESIASRALACTRARRSSSVSVGRLRGGRGAPARPPRASASLRRSSSAGSAAVRLGWRRRLDRLGGARAGCRRFASQRPSAARPMRPAREANARFTPRWYREGRRGWRCVFVSYPVSRFLPLHARAIPSSCLPVRPPKTEGRRKGNP